MTTDPRTGRATEHYANAAFCRLAGGASVEAHLARVAAHALPEHVTQLDYLCRWGRGERGRGRGRRREGGEHATRLDQLFRLTRDGVNAGPLGQESEAHTA